MIRLVTILLRVRLMSNTNRVSTYTKLTVWRGGVIYGQKAQLLATSLAGNSGTGRLKRVIAWGHSSRDCVAAGRVAAQSVHRSRSEWVAHQSGTIDRQKTYLVNISLSSCIYNNLQLHSDVIKSEGNWFGFPFKRWTTAVFRYFTAAFLAILPGPFFCYVCLCVLSVCVCAVGRCLFAS